VNLGSGFVGRVECLEDMASIGGDVWEGCPPPH